LLVDAFQCMSQISSFYPKKHVIFYVLQMLGENN